MKEIVYSFVVSPKEIDNVSNKVQEFLRDNKADRELSLKVRLCIEEALLGILEDLGENVKAEAAFSKRIGKPAVSIRFKGKNYNPLERENADELSVSVLGRLGFRPAYSYHAGLNKITFSIPATEFKQEIFLVVSVVLALILGLCGEIIPAGIKSFISDYMLTPVSDIFMKLLTMVAPILIFLTVVTSIMKNANASSFGKMGKYIIGRYLFMTVAFCAGLSALFIPCFNLCFGDASKGADGVGDLVKMLFDIVPNNIVAPFADNNMMQIILIAVLIGVIILRLDNRVDNLRGAMLDLHSVFVSAMELVCRVLPLYIFTSLLSTFWENGTESFLSLWKPITVSVGGDFACLVVLLIIVSAKCRVSLKLLIKKIMPSFIVGFTTASSIATFSTGIEINKKKLGISPAYSDIAYPLGIVLYDALYIPLFIVIPYYLAEVYSVPVSPMWFVRAAFICLIVTYASPQVSGGALVCLSILMTQLGIPMAGLPVAGILAMLLDFSTTGAKVTAQHLEMIMQAKHLKMIDMEVLRN